MLCVVEPRGLQQTFAFLDSWNAVRKAILTSWIPSFVVPIKAAPLFPLTSFLETST